MSEILVISSGVALLAAVGLVLIQAGHSAGGTKAYWIALGVASVAWSLVPGPPCVTPGRITPPRSGASISTRTTLPPIWTSFYLSLTIGITFQVSDTNLTTKRIRTIALAHALLSYLFGAVIVALAISVVANLLSK